MEKIKYIESGIVEKSFSNDTWDGEPEYMPIMRIQMTSAGGGFGGRTWYEYVQWDDENDTIPEVGTLKYFTDYNGKKIYLNTAWAVKIEPFDLVTVRLSHANGGGTDIFRYLVDKGTKVVLK